MSYPVKAHKVRLFTGIRSRIYKDADDALSPERFHHLENVLTMHLRGELRDTVGGEYHGTGYAIKIREGILTALDILGYKVEYYEEERNDEV